MTHTRKKRIDRRAAGLPQDAREGLSPWHKVKDTGKPGDRGVTPSGRVRTVPKKRNASEGETSKER